MTSSPLRIAIGIATKGRAPILREMLRDLRWQTRCSDRIIVCYTGPEDVTGIEAEAGLECVLASPGSSRQRNAILDAASDCDVVLFIDDDFLLAPRYIEAIDAVLTAHPDVVVTTGRVVADGAKGPGLTVDAARAILDRDTYGGSWPDVVPAWNGYGCNMAIRLDTARSRNVRFDERLPLYGWYEDIDFTRRLGQHGRIVRVEAARGVHLGVKSGRGSGQRLGYSQIVNPLYLWQKGSYPWDHALRSVVRHISINVVRSLWPEPYIDRRGRLMGNGLALLDVVRGRAQPERILDL
jgi:glycosyltransferase involved in cell wall biosynthesis